MTCSRCVGLGVDVAVARVLFAVLLSGPITEIATLMNPLLIFVCNAAAVYVSRKIYFHWTFPLSYAPKDCIGSRLSSPLQRASCPPQVTTSGIYPIICYQVFCFAVDWCSAWEINCPSLLLLFKAHPHAAACTYTPVFSWLSTRSGKVAGTAMALFA